MRGFHLMLDGYECSREKLWDTSLVKEMLSELPARIKMNTLSDPHTVEDHKGDIREQGVTGFIFLDESHISIHTYPEKGMVFIDIFSCKEIDEKAASEFIKGLFDVGQFQSKFLRRGEP